MVNDQFSTLGAGTYGATGGGIGSAERHAASFYEENAKRQVALAQAQAGALQNQASAENARETAAIDLLRGLELLTQRLSMLAGRAERIDEKLLGGVPKAVNDVAKQPKRYGGLMGTVEDTFAVVGDSLNRIEVSINRIEQFI